MAQKQRLVEVRADFERTIVNKVIDQWNKQAFVNAKGEHFEHSLFMICCILLTDNMLWTTVIISKEDRKKLHCWTCLVDQHALFCSDAVVAIATTQVVLDQYQTF